MIKGLHGDWLDDFKYWYKEYGILKAIWYSLPNRPRWYYTVRSWFFPYNVVRIKTLPRTWCDRVEVMYHGAFQVLVDFVEKEWAGSEYHGKLFNIEEERARMVAAGNDPEHIELEISMLERQNASTQEIMDLYNWWTKIYPNRDAHDPLNNVECPAMEFIPCEDNPKLSTLKMEFDDPEKQKAYKAGMKKHHDWDDACEAEDEEMLMRLMKIRKHLWT
jgi:hypothetical protein